LAMAPATVEGLLLAATLSVIVPTGRGSFLQPNRFIKLFISRA
jgi:hypothetical protein